jgi:hypothetical protein
MLPRWTTPAAQDLYNIVCTMYVAVTLLILVTGRGYRQIAMKPLPAPTVSGKTEFEKFDNAVRQVLTVSKEELLKREEREKHKPGTKQPKKS